MKQFYSFIAFQKNDMIVYYIYFILIMEVFRYKGEMNKM